MKHERLDEKNTRLSTSILWQLQREYYHEKGILAWANQTPFHGTSNPLMAKSYATLLMSFMQDWLALHPNSSKETFYILELGAGSGQFSFYVLKKLMELKKTLGLDALDLCYVMSDFTEKNIEHWQQHSSFAPYLKSGVIDFSLYNLETSEQIVLKRKGIELTEDTIKTPLMVISNYVFCNIAQDAFKVRNGNMFESLISVSKKSSQQHVDGEDIWNNIRISFKNKLINPGSYYSDPVVSSILTDYCSRLKKTEFLFPIASIHAVKKLLAISSNKMLLLSTDKGTAHINRIEQKRDPFHMAFHGSFSMELNFDALVQYFIKSGCDTPYILTDNNQLETCVFSIGLSLEKKNQTQRYLREHMSIYPPVNIFYLYNGLSALAEVINVAPKSVEIDIIFAFIKLFLYDPYVFDGLSNHILRKIKAIHPSEKQRALQLLAKVEEMYYYMPAKTDTLLNLALCHHHLSHYQQAIALYERSIAMYGAKDNSLFNLALCYYHTGNELLALKHFKHSYQLNSRNNTTKKWIKKLDCHGS